MRALRPAYERALDLATRGRGFLRVVNGRERFYVRPSARGWFPETYEPGVSDYLRERVRPGAVALNVGAHVGLYTLCLAEWAGEAGRVVAFEPNPATRAVLEDHVRRNRLAGRVRVEPFAVGGAPGRATFSAAPLSGTSRLGAANPDAPEAHVPLAVEVTTLDAYCAARALRPDWIVMDIEGLEVAALEGGRRVVGEGAAGPALVVELHPHLWAASDTSRAAFERLLDRTRRRVVPLTGQRDPLAEPGVVALESLPGT